MEAVGFDAKRDRQGVVVSLRGLDPGDLDDLGLIEMAPQDGEGRIGNLLGVRFLLRKLARGLDLVPSTLFGSIEGAICRTD